MNIAIIRKLAMVGMLIVGILVLIIWNSITVDARLRRTQYWVAHTYIVLLALEHVEDAVVTTESSARRYIISGTAESYDAYIASRSNVADSVHQVRLLCVDNPEQTNNCDALDRAVNQRIDRLEYGVNLRRKEGPSFLLKVGTMHGPGIQRMAELRQILARMEGNERALLTSRAHANDEGIHRSALNAAYLVLVIVLLMVAVGGLIARDVESHRQADAVARQLRVAFARSGEGIARFDSNDRLVTANEAYAMAAGYRPDEMVGMNRTELVDPSNRDVAAEAIARMRRDGEASVEILCLRKDGSCYYKQSTMVVVNDDHHGGVYVFSRDITERKRQEMLLQQQRSMLVEANERLEDMASRDGLTGVKNRRAFEELLDREVRASIRYGFALSLIMLDVDHFKQFNDTYGHQAGDEALQQVAHILQQCSRDVDSVARYGGEEFVLVLPNTEAVVAAAVAERLRGAVEVLPNPHRKLTISVGVATLDRGMDAASLVRRADAALYAAKSAGRNRVIDSSSIARSSVS